ncbi:L-seryl-tRNA(Ser) seleniumtransferase [Saccharopolyspora lacisalsi]|uniref:L-seryl-tRNA(Sec) selenium transferase n=1 Tax=Halosaccharopolyspora lacisalsi TaxID=1000566 RepID=A0A839E0T3_9PSEU|nr:L-seryl-tRNA(Sec) selenium transferase [Halosaccharopolyspora lacisalsi]MBA8824588.1 L-seryl-tRNA(Ser) seleniumtransferase [Halosaccharopolyspora lacisalsi]
MGDPRRHIPATDRILNEPRVAEAAERLGRERVKQAVHEAQQRARDGEIAVQEVVEGVLAELPESTLSLRRVLNASGVLLHTNLGRAPLSGAAVRALTTAAGTTDVELDLETGHRGRRGTGALAALREAVPTAQAAHVVNNGAAALALAATALAADREIVVARGELVEIGDGFRIPELLASTGARLREVGTTNRVHLSDYRDAIGPDTGFVLKVHPSNFVISGFTSAVSVAALSELDVPVVADIGSGLLSPHPRLPAEPDATTALAEGADVVTASGDKLLGGPQAGMLLGDAELVERLRRDPLARALRVDKLTLAALEVTVRGPSTPTGQALERDERQLWHRAERIAEILAGAGVAAETVSTTAAVGGGGAPGVELPSAAVGVAEHLAKQLRTGDPPVLARVEQGRCLLDLHALPPEEDTDLVRAVLSAVR